MTDFTRSPEATGLVTFALFAYNQEAYVREAVLGAFAQSYGPLEIILSDDCSTDSTFSIMKEMAHAYNGPHTVIARQSEGNRGLMRHISDVVEISTGRIIVVAAGDDVSFAHRTETLVSLMDDTNSSFAASNYHEMGAEGEIGLENLTNDYSKNYAWKVIDANVTHFANGATAAYKKSFMEAAILAFKKTAAKGNIYNEDIAFAAYAAAIGAFPSEYTDGALINYRINNSSLSNFKVANDSLNEEISLVKREKFRAHSRFATLSAILEIAENYPELNTKLRHENIQKDMRLCQLQIAATDSNIFKRLAHLRYANDIEEAKICLARLFGLSFLAMMRVSKRNLRGVLKKREGV